MKKYCLLFIVSFTSISVHAQQFSFPIYFQDSLGNKDTLVMGYDVNASDTIDAAFGEVNIRSTPFDSVFEARISDFNANFQQCSLNTIDPTSYQTKKQIQKNKCSTLTFPTVFTICLKAKYFPILVTWPDSLFYDTCQSASIITNWFPGGWFDAVCGSFPIQVNWLSSPGSFLFTKTPEQFLSATNPSDSINLLYIAISSPADFSVDINLQNRSKETKDELLVSPNPGKGKFHLSAEGAKSFTALKIFDSKGIQLYNLPYREVDSEFDLDAAAHQEGLYFITCLDENGRLRKGKFILTK